MPLPPRRRRWPVLAAVTAMLVGVAAIAYVLFLQKPGDVSNPNVAFNGRDAAARAAPGAHFVWPVYGYTPQRTRYLNASLRPGNQLWQFVAGSLIEFQPVLAHGHMYLVANNGTATALSTSTGKVEWQRSVGTLNASSPAWADGKLYVVTLSRAVMCLDAATGATIWQRPLPSRSESSPLVLNGRVYFGSEDGTVYALSARTGATIWTYKAPAAVKAALAYSSGRLYFGDYAGDA